MVFAGIHLENRIVQILENRIVEIAFFQFSVSVLHRGDICNLTEDNTEEEAFYS